MVYVFWTCRNLEEAKAVIRYLLEERLIACASILPHCLSFFQWNGKIEESEEVKVIFKTQENHFLSLCKCIQERGSYEVPEIVEISCSRVHSPYLNWVQKETSIS